jgi:hypothetical protein
MKHGIWSSGQWVRFNYYNLERDQNGKYTGNTIPSYCFYKIRNFQIAKGTFSVIFPEGYLFNIEDGSLVDRGEKQEKLKVSPLSPDDEAYVKEHLAIKPDMIMLRRPKRR